MMRVLLLSAGRGERMRPLTDLLPKPLLEVGGRALVEHHLARLAAAGFTEVVINVAWHGEQVKARLGDGSAYGVSIAWSDEGPDPLETAGGIVHARALLGEKPFAVVNSDIWTDYPFERLALPGGKSAHLVLVPNPPHNPDGDFTLWPDDESGLMTCRSRSVIGDQGTLTFAGIAVYSPALFADLEPGKRPLAPILRAACDRGEVSGERHDGEWEDIGTVERLERLRQRLA